MKQKKMALTLLLLRHGKSDWGGGDVNDHDRSLAPRGEVSARLVGQFLTSIEKIPDEILSSTATRACQTARLAAESGGWSCPLRTSGNLYGRGPGDVLGELRDSSSASATVLLVGHEPTWSQLTGALIGGATLHMPPGGLACVELAVEDWRKVGPATGRLKFLVTPKMLQRMGLGD